MDAKMLNSEAFLQKYRVLEGMLEKRYEDERPSSVVMEYLRDGDSLPVRVDLDMLREIRNILSHNANSDGSAVVEPSDETVARLDRVLAHVRRPRFAGEFGTPASRVLAAHPNDLVQNVMRNMRKNGYSHVPVVQDDAIIGVFSLRSAFDFLAENGLDSLKEGARIGVLGKYTRLDRQTGERYMFVAAEESIETVRNAFKHHAERDRRLSCAFVTQTGSPEEPLVCILTPWDVLSDNTPTKEAPHERGKEQGHRE